MGILGIENRTENWKTARVFSLFFEDDAARLRLAGKLGTYQPNEAKIELFWTGMRDHLYEKTKSGGGRNEDHFQGLGNLYDSLFPDLREKIGAFRSGNQHLNLPQKWNYKPAFNVDSTNRLGNNLVATEIDVVLETPDSLFVGEAKHESDFGTDGRDVLVHQLIRQYVMAWILVIERGCNKRVVPFVVVDRKNLDSVKNTLQVKFMIEQGWLLKRNVLPWDDIKELA